MKTTIRKARFLPLVAAAAILSMALAVHGDDPKSKLVVHDISFWVFDTSCENVNDRSMLPSGLPGLADSLRSRDIPGIKDPVSPFGLMTFYELSTGNLDIDLQLKAGRFLADWPAGERKSKRIKWSQIAISPKLADESKVVYVGDHWFNSVRETPQPMYVSTTTRTERFLCYDAELKAPLPIKITGGPEKFKVANLTSNPIHDLILSVPTEKGRRLAWLATLPAGKAKPKAPAGGAAKGKGDAAKDAKSANDTKEKTAAKAEKVAVAEKPAKEAKKEGEAKPADGAKKDGKKADDKKKADAKPAEELNAQQKATAEKLAKPITLKMQGAALEDALDFFRNQIGVQIRIAEEAKRDFPSPRGPAVNVEEKNAKGDEALKKLLGRHELLYEIEKNGFILIMHEEAKNKPAVIAGDVEPGAEVEIELAAPIADNDQAGKTKAIDRWKGQFNAAGLSDFEVKLIASQFSEAIFSSHDLVLSGRLAHATIDEWSPLEVLPIPAKTIRVPIMLVRNIDPRIKLEVAQLIIKLGDAKYSERESAEKRLIELGMVAVPELKTALTNTDVEVVFRAERILEALGQQLPDEKK